MNGQFYVSSCSGTKTVLIVTFISVGNSHLDGELTITEQGQAVDFQLSGQQREPEPLTAHPGFVRPGRSKQASSTPLPIIWTRDLGAQLLPNIIRKGLKNLLLTNASILLVLPFFSRNKAQHLPPGTAPAGRWGCRSRSRSRR